MTDHVHDGPSYYEILGVDKDADLATIKSRFRKLALKWHPDRIADPSKLEEAKDQFPKISGAWEVLSDSDRRQRYDDQRKLAELRKTRHEEVRNSGATQRAPRCDYSYAPPPVRESENGKGRYDDHGIERPTRTYSVGYGPARSVSELRSPQRSTRLLHRKPYVGSVQQLSGDLPDEAQERGPRPPSNRHRDTSRFADGKFDESVPRAKSKASGRTRPSRSGLSRFEQSHVVADQVSSDSEDEVSHKNRNPQLNDRASIQQHKSTISGRSHSKFQCLRGTINGYPVAAATDTGADGNFISQFMAANADIQTTYLRTEDRPIFLMAHGRGLRPVGKARALWRFEYDTDEVHEMDFFVLEECIFDIMIGAEFVYKHRILSNSSIYSKTFLAQGLVRHTKPDAIFCSALPDSGAEPNIISYAYAERRGWLSYVEPGPPSWRVLQFADGSIEETMGRLILYWRFRSPGVAKRAGSLKRHEGKSDLRRQATLSQAASLSEGYFTFDVLHRCPWDMMVGHVFLDSTAAFNTMAHCFTAMESTFPLGLNPVIWSKAKSSKTSKKTNTNTTPASVSAATAPPQNSFQDDLEALAMQYEEERRQRRRQQESLPLPRPRSGSISTRSSVTGAGTTGSTAGAASVAITS